jgi:hypothetical protein
MKPKKKYVPREYSMDNVMLFFQRGKLSGSGVVKIYTLGVDYLHMKVVKVDGLSHVGQVPSVYGCRNKEELVERMKKEGWIKCSSNDISNLNRYNQKSP